MAVFSSLLLFGVDCMIRSQLKANRPVEHRETKYNASLISGDNNSSAYDSAYKDAESQPMLEDECSSTLFNLTISEFLMLSDRESVL